MFIPSKNNKALPKPEEINEEKLFSENPEGLFITPPGLALSKLFEKELGTSFTKTDINYMQTISKTTNRRPGNRPKTLKSKPKKTL
jgi:hypothetical protein